MRYHVVIDLCDEAVVFKDRYELAGRNEAHVGSVPADKRFGTLELVSPRIVLRLVVNHKFLIVYSDLLSLCNDADPLLFVDEFLVEECDSGFTVRDGHAGRTSIVVVEIHVCYVSSMPRSELLISGIYKINTGSERKLIVSRDSDQGTDDIL